MTQWVVHHKKEPYDIFIARPSKWSNPYSSKDHSAAEFIVDSRAESLYRYAVWVLGNSDFVDEVREHLSGKVLGCWCAPKKRCHGELLAAIANDLPLPDYAPRPPKDKQEPRTLF